MFFTMIRPSPIPSFFVVKKGVKIFSFWSAEMPGPWSVMSIMVRSSSLAELMNTDSPGGEA